MPGSSIGLAFRVTTAGESHGPANVVVVDGCPPGLALSEDDLLPDLARRRPGQSRIVSQRQEDDTPEILSGVFEGLTTGTPIAVLVRNRDAKPGDYDDATIDAVVSRSPFDTAIVFAPFTTCAAVSTNPGETTIPLPCA